MKSGEVKGGEVKVEGVGMKSGVVKGGEVKVEGVGVEGKGRVCGRKRRQKFHV